eukprot:173499-Pleurochrysis_carterae.AAC.1
MGGWTGMCACALVCEQVRAYARARACTKGRADRLAAGRQLDRSMGRRKSSRRSRRRAGQTSMQALGRKEREKKRGRAKTRARESSTDQIKRADAAAVATVAARTCWGRVLCPSSRVRRPRARSFCQRATRPLTRSPTPPRVEQECTSSV